MKLYCEKCKKVFEAEKPETGDKVPCPECKEEVTFPESPTSPGAVIADFLIERPLSKGGMGEVYLARQLSLDRPVALKVLQAKFLDDKEYVEAFFREARAAGRISHPNVVQAYAVGEENGTFYFAMEFIRGKTMKEILQEEKVLDFQKAAKIIREVASALEAAWRDEKLVHQDIKPDNIMLDANGFAKLADLGLARVAGINDKEATEGDEVLGTPQYISPEQLTGIPTDVRSDIYSLGATFYQFVTGRYPYVAETSEEIAKMHVAGKLQPPKEVNPELPDELNTIIMKMMARDLEDRYQTPAPLIKALDMYLQNAGASASGGAIPKLNLNMLKKPGAAPGAGVPGKPPFGVRPGAGAPGAALARPGGAAPAAAPKGAVPPAAPKPVPPGPPAAAAPKPTPPGPPPAPKPAAAPVPKPAAAPVPKPAAAPVPKPAPAPKSEESDGDEVLKVAARPAAAAPAPEAVEEQGKKGAGKKEKKEKKGKASGQSAGKMVLSLILVVVLILFTIGCLGGAFYALSVGGKLPEALKPHGEKFVAFIKGKLNPKEGEVKSEGKEGTEGVKPPVPVVPEPPKIVTRPEYIAGIEALLNQIRENTLPRETILANCDKFFNEFPQAVTDEEAAQLKTLLPVYHRMDEVARVAPARSKAHEAFMTALNSRKAAEENAKQAEATRKEEERKQREQAEAEAKKRADEERRKQAEAKAAADERLKKIRPELQTLFGNAADQFLEAGNTGNLQVANDALSQLRLYLFPANADSQEETQLMARATAYGRDLPEELKKYRAFVETLATVSPEKNGFSVELPNRELVTVVGVVPGRVTAVDGNNRPVNLDLSNPRTRNNFLQRLSRLKLEKPAFYFDLMMGDFSPETAKAAGQMGNFWKSYYKPFITDYFRVKLKNASSAEKAALEKRYGSLPEFREANQ